MDSYSTYQAGKQSYPSASSESVTETAIRTDEDFIRFYSDGERYPDNGGFLIVTGRQYIFCRNGNGGSEGHMTSVARACLEIEGRGTEHKRSDLIRIGVSDRYTQHMIFSLEVETINNNFHQSLRISLKRKSISPEELEVLTAFCERFGPVMDKCHIPIFVAMPEKHYYNFESIPQMLAFFKSIVDEKTKAPEFNPKEKILGVEVRKPTVEQVL